MAPAKVHCHHTEWVRGHLRGHTGIVFQTNKQQHIYTFGEDALKHYKMYINMNKMSIKVHSMDLFMDFCVPHWQKQLPEHRERFQ